MAPLTGDQVRSTMRSESLFSEARKLLPGGVNSPVRAFKAVGGNPLFIERGEGAYLFDVDGNRYVDYVLSWGPLILGHAHPRVVEAISETAKRGTSFGAPSPLEVELARVIVHLMPNIDVLRFVNSGTEAAMSAIRLARAATKRHKVIKFQGAYHGHADMLLVQAGSGAATLGLPDSPGVTPGAVSDTLIADYNDLESVRAIFDTFPEEVATVIVEPVVGNMGLVPPQDGFLQGLRDITRKFGSLLIFDEVMTGFRVHPGGAQALYNVKPDLTVLGKVVGGGLPVGAYGGRRELMELIAPQGPVYQAGTLSGNPLAMAAGIAALDVLRDPVLWEKLHRAGDRLVAGLQNAAADAGVPVQCRRVGAMVGLFFSDIPVLNWKTAAKSDVERFGRFHIAMLDRGVYLPPSQFESAFLSIMHGDTEIDHTIESAAAAFRIIA
ncbi:MAG TPA: glutamate-1-semialdehyde 2,1-aminomutase [Candidatus Krumholzibacteria bacterium]|nr:glutamate-1-semialdehyde 2,1-aminomutase [Candidatus Krumholzibacteria bacterium]